VRFGTSDAEATIEESFTEIYGDLPNGNYAPRPKDREEAISERAEFQICLRAREILSMLIAFLASPTKCSPRTFPSPSLTKTSHHPASYHSPQHATRMSPSPGINCAPKRAPQVRMERRPPHKLSHRRPPVADGPHSFYPPNQRHQGAFQVLQRGCSHLARTFGFRRLRSTQSTKRGSREI
jgi:hypothetical protein